MILYLVLTNRDIVGKVFKLPVAGKEVGVFFFGQSIEVFCVGSTKSLFSSIDLGRQLVTAMFPLFLPGQFSTERDVNSLARLRLVSAEVVFWEARLFAPHDAG